MGPGVMSILKRLLLNLRRLGNEQERRIVALSVRLQTQDELCEDQICVAFAI